MQSKQPIRELILHVLKMYLFTGMVEHSGLSSALLFTIIIYYILNEKTPWMMYTGSLEIEASEDP